MYKFQLNPYPDQRISRCYDCESNTGQRKLPLLIYIEPQYLIAINYTNRYCRSCDMLIGHKHEIEDYLTQIFIPNNPKAIGNPYIIIGTVEKSAWKKEMDGTPLSKDIAPHVHDFKAYEELRLSHGGWFKNGVEPPEMVPPPSEHWAKGIVEITTFSPQKKP